MPQCFGLKDFGKRMSASSLQPFLLGLEDSKMGSAAGKWLPLKVASLLHLFLMFLVAMFRRVRDTESQFISGSLILSWDGGSRS